jgi:hypothetical protein
MATKEKTADGAVVQLEKRIEKLREQLKDVVQDRDALRQQLADATGPKKREPKPFIARKFPINGFVVSITGKGCMEEEIFVQVLGDTIVVDTGDAATIARSGGHSVTPVRAGARPALRAVPKPEEESWSNVADPTGLGPSPKAAPEAVAKALQTGDLSAISPTDWQVIQNTGAGVL